MSLYIDGPFVTASDLAVIDSEVPAVAEAQQIATDGVIAEACADFASWLRGRLQRFHGRQQILDPDRILSWHMESVNRPRIGIQQVIVHNPESPGEWSDLKRLCVHWALWHFYRNASRRKDVDRYQEKRDDYRAEVERRLQHRLIRNGLPVVEVPLPCPGATRVTGAGTFGNASLSLIAGATAETTPIDVRITWTAADAESGPSPLAQISVTVDKAARVAIGNLQPPAAGYFAGSDVTALVRSRVATGWNVYAGPRGGTLTLQNPSPLDLTTTTFDLAATLDTTGAEIGTGQNPDRWVSVVSTFDRA